MNVTKTDMGGAPLHRRSWRLTIAVASAGLLVGAGVLPVAAAGASGPATTLSVSSLAPAGGLVTVTATPTSSGTCVAVVTPANPVVPAAVACKAGVPVQISLDFTGNATAKPVAYKVSVHSCLNGTCASLQPSSLTQQANKISAVTVSAVRSIKQAACISATTCVVLDAGNTVEVVTSSPSRTVSVTHLSDPATLAGLACSTSGHCVVADLDGDGYTYNGKAWSAFKLPMSFAADNVFVSCPTSLCIALWTITHLHSSGIVHRDLAVRFAGGAAPPTVISDVNADAGATAMDCIVGTEDCVISDAKAKVSKMSSVNSNPLYRGISPLVSISCPSKEVCVGVDATGGTVQFNPSAAPSTARYRPGTQQTTRLTVVRCATSTTCLFASSSSLQMAQSDQWPDIGDLDYSSALFSLTAAGTSLALATVPGSPTMFRIYGKAKEMTGHVTLIR